MKKNTLLPLILISLLGFGCNRPQPVLENPTPPEPSPVTQTTVEPTAPPPTKYPKRIVSESIIGSWHAAPLVGSGFSQRYSFFENGMYLYISSEYDYDSKNQLGAESGTWKLTDNTLTLNTTAGLKITVHADDTVGFEKVSVKKQTVITLGAFEKTEPSIVYSLQRSFDKMTYWKFADTSDYWCPPSSKYHQENPDRDYKACDLLLNVYSSSAK